MTNNTKEMIAQAVGTLLMEKRVRQLTVTDIVNECHITRQAFYYHFSDIPDLLQWIMLQQQEKALEEYRGLESGEDQIRYWLLIAVNGNAYVRKGMKSNYSNELGQMIFQRMQSVFSTVVETDGAFSALAPFEKDLLIRYNCHAVAGLMYNWTEKDTENIDEIAIAFTGLSPDRYPLLKNRTVLQKSRSVKELDTSGFLYIEKLF